MKYDLPTLPPAPEVSHNQVGQRLGRKGQETRERILAAMLQLLADRDGPAVTFTAVAKEAQVRLSNLYLYFPDMSQMLLAALGRVMDTAEGGYMEKLRRRWPDETLYDACLAFLKSHFEFWERNARILHMRNALADAGDLGIFEYRHAVTTPLITLLIEQMGDESGNAEVGNIRVATVLTTCLERVATAVTNPQIWMIAHETGARNHRELVRELIAAEAEIMTLAIGHRRALGAQVARPRSAASG